MIQNLRERGEGRERVRKEGREMEGKRESNKMSNIFWHKFILFIMSPFTGTFF